MKNAIFKRNGRKGRKGRNGPKETQVTHTQFERSMHVSMKSEINLQGHLAPGTDRLASACSAPRRRDSAHLALGSWHLALTGAEAVVEASGLLCRSALALGTEASNTLMYMPGGISEITPSQGGKAVRVQVLVDPRSAVALEAQRAALQAKARRPTSTSIMRMAALPSGRKASSGRTGRRRASMPAARGRLPDGRRSKGASSGNFPQFSMSTTPRPGPRGSSAARMPGRTWAVSSTIPPFPRSCPSGRRTQPQPIK